MSRLLRVYFTLIFFGALLANLFFIALYGQQFLFEAVEAWQCFCVQPTGKNLVPSLLLINAAVIGVALFGYLTLRLLNHHGTRR